MPDQPRPSYEVIKKTSIKDLEYEVNEKMNQGFRPTGGVFVMETREGTNFYQALVKGL